MEFGGSGGSLDADILGGLTLERMHLASAAHWWLEQGHGVVHAPRSVAELDRWLFNTLSFLRHEASRCVILAKAA